MGIVRRKVSTDGRMTPQDTIAPPARGAFDPPGEDERIQQASSRLTPRPSRITLIPWGRLRKLAMADFDHILNWTLKPGSHTFPGQDGGTCINEAAIVAGRV